MASAASRATFPPGREMSEFKVILAQPRGFCAGVDRAIDIVERALAKFGAPIYVRHEIVHNRRVVEQLRGKGAIFVEELTDVPEGAVVIFSAHGVSKGVVAEAAERRLRHVDATCPLVTKVHREADAMVGHGKHIILIGHAGHPEVEGTLGQVGSGTMTLVEAVEDVDDECYLCKTIRFTTSQWWHRLKHRIMRMI